MIDSGLISLPSAFHDKSRAKTIWHNLVRGKTLRRTLGIPNPIHFYRLARFTVENWGLLSAAASTSTLSLTKPLDSPTGRPFGNAALADRPLHRARVRAGSRFIVRADIARFYPTLYTHSIPWALHTKAVAKRSRGRGLEGDTLDRLIRDGQDGQTLGIPVGPDTSLLTAEIVLSAVDAAFQKPGLLRGFRYIDDYEIGCQTLSEAEGTCTRLQEALGEFELALNPAKTRISALPLPLQEAAFSELRVLRLRSNPAAQRADLFRFFDRAFGLSLEEPDQHVLNYAIGRLGHSTVDTSNWSCLQDLLIQAVVTAPSCLRFVLDEVWRYRELGYSIDGPKIATGLNAVVAEHSSFNHGNEVSWAIWGLLILGESLTTEAVTAAAKMSDPVVALLLLHAHERGLVAGPALGGYLPYMTTEELRDKQWLLSYEANIKGWLPSFGGSADHVNADPCFSHLKANGVSFYDSDILDATAAPPSSFAAETLFPSGGPRASYSAPGGEAYE
jgi:hypothetical protein